MEYFTLFYHMKPLKAGVCFIFESTSPWSSPVWQQTGQPSPASAASLPLSWVLSVTEGTSEAALHACGFGSFSFSVFINFYVSWDCVIRSVQIWTLVFLVDGTVIVKRSCSSPVMALALEVTLLGSRICPVSSLWFRLTCGSFAVTSLRAHVLRCTCVKRTRLALF